MGKAEGTVYADSILLVSDIWNRARLTVLVQHGNRRMMLLPLKFTIRALSKRVAFEDGSSLLLTA